MSSIAESSLESLIQNLKRDGRLATLRKVIASKRAIVGALGRPDDPHARGELVVAASELSDQLDSMEQIVDAIQDALFSHSTAMGGFLQMLEGLQETKLNSIHVLALLTPHYHQIRAAYHAFGESLAD